MRYAIVVLGAVVVGCDEISEGEADSGLAAEVAAVGGYRWHDARGVQVTEGPDLVTFDAQGHLWQIDAETAKVGGLRVEQLLYDANPCDTLPRLDAPPAGMVVWINVPAAEVHSEVKGYYVRADDQDAEWGGYGAYRKPGDGICRPVGEVESRWWIYFGGLLALPNPEQPGWLAPLHPEPIE